ncbi:MAG TPA: response regulator [Permianibacter sp.]|nr:response regulator [Permianibacter sp.]
MPSIAMQDLHILLIEPSPTQQKIVLNHLREAGVHQVDTAASGHEALAYLHQHETDLVISAMYLPDMDATHVLLRLRADPRWQNLAFMLVSSETRFRAIDPIKQAGVVAILPKPFLPADIERALRATLRYIDPEELALENYDVSEVRVLVVDDSSTARAHIKRMLSDLGIQHITLAVDGKHAITCFNEQLFDLVVTDYNMPEMDGRELVEAIRARSDGAYIPILMVTSETERARLSQVEQAGVSALLDKPFTPEVIRQALYSLLSH